MSQPKLRTSCDPCSSSKVRCTKEKPGCSRCSRNGLECVYGRSQRKGKPPSKTSFTHIPPRQSLSSHALPPSPSSLSPPGQSPGRTEQYENSTIYNYHCPWSRSPMFPTMDYANPSVANEDPTEYYRTDNELTTYPSLLNGDGSASHFSAQPRPMPWSNLAVSNSTSPECAIQNSFPGMAAHQEYNHIYNSQIRDPHRRYIYHQQENALETPPDDPDLPYQTLAYQIPSPTHEPESTSYYAGH
ncbi:transcriptional regulator family: Fungal Specific TF [Penicillium soppii]|uniref:transcriptional regulator family: Fungal Specific TF n=1 Tax=Penicillium soppii TaxID=69789 RepID=UPI002549A126|nr:transcriptional regulator family: Fungal Specific TF [Penicillium soppii]KAJ5852596.1 transcriptional regulator family: Fungal Specific TF [Penicillium soppii]